MCKVLEPELEVHHVESAPDGWLWRSAAASADVCGLVAHNESLLVYYVTTRYGRTGEMEKLADADGCVFCRPPGVARAHAACIRPE